MGRKKSQNSEEKNEYRKVQVDESVQNLCSQFRAMQWNAKNHAEYSTPAKALRMKLNENTQPLENAHRWRSKITWKETWIYPDSEN